MARLFNGTDQDLRRADAVYSAIGLTFHAWVWPDSDAGVHRVCNISIGSSNRNFIALQLRGDLAGDPIEFNVQRDAASSGPAHTTTGYTTTGWQAICGIEYAADSRAVFRNGGNKGTDTTSVGTKTTDFDNTRIGGLRFNGNDYWYDGRIAEVVLWGVALTDAEVAILAKGVSPLLVRPASIIAYWPLIGRYSPEIDLVGGYDMTLTNAPTAAAHPRVFAPTPRLWAPLSPAAGAALVKVLDESEGVSEGSVRALGFVRLIAETEATTENTLRTLGFVRVLSESVGLAEATSRLRAMRRLAAEAVDVNEATLRVRSLIRQLDESLGLSEAVGRLRSRVEVLSESVGLTEATDKVSGFVRVLSESVGLTEATQTLTGLVRWIDESVGVTEATGRARALARLVAETAGVSEAVGRLRSMTRAVSEAVGASESVVRVTGLVRVIDESLGLSEAIQRVLTNPIVVSVTRVVFRSKRKDVDIQ